MTHRLPTSKGARRKRARRGSAAARPCLPKLVGRRRVDDFVLRHVQSNLAVGARSSRRECMDAAQDREKAPRRRHNRPARRSMPHVSMGAYAGEGVAMRAPFARCPCSCRGGSRQKMMIHASERVRHAETCMQDRFRPMAQPTCSCYALHAACACVGLCASNIAVADQLMRQRSQRIDHGLHLPAAAALQPMVCAPSKVHAAPPGRLHLCGAAALRKNCAETRQGCAIVGPVLKLRQR